jgi:hypothetical protein
MSTKLDLLHAVKIQCFQSNTPSEIYFFFILQIGKIQNYSENIYITFRLKVKDLK